MLFVKSAQTGKHVNLRVTARNWVSTHGQGVRRDSPWT